MTLTAGLGLLFSASSAQAGRRDRDSNDIPRLGGRYRGFYNDVRNDDARVDDTRIQNMQIGIDRQRFRFFAGNLHIGPVTTFDSADRLFSIRGVVNSQSKALFAGRNRGAWLFGRFEFFDAGFGGAVLEGGMNVRNRDGDNARGPIVLLRRFDDSLTDQPTVDLNGVYEGKATSAVTGEEAKMRVLLRGDGESAQVTFKNEDREIEFPAGHWTAGGQRQLLAIGQGRRAYTVLDGRLSVSTDAAGAFVITGRYKIEPVVADGDTGRFEIERVTEPAPP